jgi:hypothetical protein
MKLSPEGVVEQVEEVVFVVRHNHSLHIWGR